MKSFVNDICILNTLHIIGKTSKEIINMNLTEGIRDFIMNSNNESKSYEVIEVSVVGNDSVRTV